MVNLIAIGKANFINILLRSSEKTISRIAVLQSEQYGVKS